VDKFNPDAVCPKCGSKDISARWKDAVLDYWEINNPKVKTPELIERTCRGCHYQWSELPLDAKESKCS